MKKWRIGIDARSVHRPGGGVPHYSIGLINSLGAHSGAYEYVFVVEAGGPIDHVSFPAGSEFYETRVKKDSRMLRDAWENIVLPRVLSRMGVHLYHGLDYTIPCVRTPFLKISTMHDAAVFTDHDEREWVSKSRMRILEAAIARTADAIVTDSDYSRLQLVHHLQIPAEKMRVVWVGIDDHYYGLVQREVESQVRARLGGWDRYILYCGGFRRSKNIDLLLKALAIMEGCERPRLVLVGNSGVHSERLKALVRELGLDAYVRWYGYATTEELACLLRGCMFFVFPSQIEGFGLPVAEAMACGAPVVCSKAASLPEIGGDAARYFDPGDPYECANLMAEIIRNDNLLRSMQKKSRERARLFTTKESTGKLVAVYSDLLEKQCGRT